MCGRYALDAGADEIASAFQVGVGSATAWSASWNIAPTLMVPVIRNPEGTPRLELLRWGLVPEWSTNHGRGPVLINARCETIDEKPAFRSSFRNARCIVPIRAFYEWSGDRRRRHVWAIRDEGDALYGLAGIWSSCDQEDGTRLSTFSIVTKAAGPALHSIHDRMPVILRGGDRDRWLDHRRPEDGGPDRSACRSMLEKADDRGLRIHRVSNRVGSTGNDDPDLLRELRESEVDRPIQEPGLFGTDLE